MNLAERIDDFLEERANAEVDWDDQVSAFRDFVEMELQEQRTACHIEAIHASGGYLSNAVGAAILNAVEKKI